MKLTRKWATTVIYKGRSLAVSSLFLPSLSLLRPSVSVCFAPSASLFPPILASLPTPLFSPPTASPLSSSFVSFSSPHFLSLLPSRFGKKKKKKLLSLCLQFPIQCSLSQNACVCVYIYKCMCVCVCMCLCVRATCPQSQWKHLFPSASGDRLCISLLLLALVFFFFPSPSITRFVLPTQGQLEDCFQPPVSSPTHYALLCGWPSAPVRLCIICAVWWLFVHVWESWRKGVFLGGFFLCHCAGNSHGRRHCVFRRSIHPSIHPILMDAISQECSDGIFFLFDTYIHKDSRINWFDVRDAESQESIAYYDNSFTQLVTAILNAPWAHTLILCRSCRSPLLPVRTCVCNIHVSES